ncbi:ATP-binding protein [Jhaorihella thermophila]|uniref:histidine kinase n=1 Tax=Jhaorihella thermophila TaxID=488547 RepID=A0A1H5WVP5_9RHOB|nr:ATP-binding protein [Jhaorihella thermophila]SEG03017.1 two-component system, OmpR family, osmolarity sensor histidine kinase EnvZ [Jhaorihella thermophila]
MSFTWLKRYMPRSLYARAAMILIVPVLALQAIVTVRFITDDLRGVTRQMTLTVSRELRLLADLAEGAGSPQEALDRLAPYLQTLNMGLRFVPPDQVPATDRIPWSDYSARIVRDTLRAELPETLAVSFLDSGRVSFFFRTDLGPAEVFISRRRVTAATPHQLIVVTISFGLLLTGIAYLYLRNQLRPIAKLAKAAEAFGRGRSVPYTPAGATEVRAAGSAFLDMRNRIERHIEQRTLMLSGVSHDLRTPLTRLRLGLSMLDEDDARPLLQDVAEMERLVETFLDFARGAAEGEPEETDPHDLVRQIVADAQRAGKPVEIAELSGSGALPLRPVAIRRAVENLLDNAVRYGSRAELSVALTDRSLRIRVEDDGPGIPPEQRAEAVRPFTRLDTARNQNKGSSVGLGMAIAMDVARAHGGTLRLGESERLGGLRADIVIAR